MPLTPYHFGPHACIALPLGRHLDLPVFIGANVIVDIEPVLVVVLRLRYPLHGYAHTLLMGSLVGLAWATAMYPLRGLVGKAMRLVRLPYEPSYLKMALSGVLGVWLHVILDSFLYNDIRPFFPLDANPLLGLVYWGALYRACAVSFLPALAIYVYVAFVRGGTEAAARPAGAGARAREGEGPGDG
ncbi:MAG: hydrolase [Planctomycetota bacterium]|jgi:membrane-bound metal-dependent hydrolase YbcI (DUF457 family)